MLVITLAKLVLLTYRFSNLSDCSNLVTKTHFGGFFVDLNNKYEIKSNFDKYIVRSKESLWGNPTP